MVNSAKRTEVVHCLRWVKWLLITACDKDGTCSRVRERSKRRRKQLTRSSGILNAAGTSGDASAVKAGISFDRFFDSLEICISQCIATARKLDRALTLYCTKAAGMFFLSKRTLTQHSPTCSKVFLTSSASSVLVRVRSRLVARLARPIVRMYSVLTLQQRCMPKERRLLAHSLQSPRHH